MNERERLIGGAVLTLILFLTPTFVLHVSPRFPGSLAGSLLGIAAASLMVLLLVYPLAKYNSWIKARIASVASMPSLLAFHAYAGVFGALLAILHTGHKYQSPLGIALMVTMLTVVVTGFVGRYYLPQVSTELRGQQAQLAALRSAYDRSALALARQGTADEALTPGAIARPNIPILQLVDGIADLEYTIGSREAVKIVLRRWVVAHVIAAILMYLLLALHVAGEVYYGLRWLT